MSQRILIIGGDNTSDRFGAALANKIHDLRPQVTVYGVGGPLMNDAGVRLLFDISEIVSLGVFQSVKGSTVIKRLIARVVETMDQEEPAVVLQIGLPVFGLKLLEIARSRGIPVLYYYTPFSRGLSHANLRQFGNVVTKVAAISKTEAALCADAGIDVEFVGHPLMDLADHTVTPAAAREKLGLPAEGKVVAVLPGAREVEVRHVLPPVCRALDLLTKEHSDLQVILSLAPIIRTTLVEEILKSVPCDNVRWERSTYNVLSAADAAITSIGTASLEASLLGVPSLAVYRVPRTTYFAERVLDRKPYMTITNKILRKSVIPEFIQGSLNPQRIADTLEQLLYDEQARGNMLKEFSGLDGELGETGAVERAVRLLLRMAGCGDHGTTSS
ncbi:MAG TPA: hypothetical protein GX014_02295 [Firmicutes bacterium]|jgi:lipid-A-disaccharide synthase|nr:hypothetical protein [Bacillota bacterium]HHT42219.1 hypothetical protein [Bacillota bacterium]